MLILATPLETKPSLESTIVCVIVPSRTFPQASSYRICPILSIWLQKSATINSTEQKSQTPSSLWWLTRPFNNTVYASVCFSCHCCNCDLYKKCQYLLWKYRPCCAITSELFYSLCTLMNNTHFIQRDIPSKLRIHEGEEKPNPVYF